MYFVIYKTIRTGNEKLKCLASGHQKVEKANEHEGKERKSAKQVRRGFFYIDLRFRLFSKKMFFKARKTVIFAH